MKLRFAALGILWSIGLTVAIMAGLFLTATFNNYARILEGITP